MNRNTLYWFITFAILIGACGGVYYRYQDTLPCKHPIPVAIGTVDPRFGISTKALMADVDSAIAIWNKAAGKPLLAYDPKAELKINFVYDEREATAKLGSAIALEQSKGEDVRATLDALQARFTAEQDAYNEKVQAINARGGATQAESAILKTEAASLRKLANSVNDQVESYNASVRALNAKVAEFNKSAGRTFEQGQYVRDASGERITIFQFIGDIQLTRVLAHEFGHAIGLDHNDDPKAIMYAQNESGNLVPTKADLSSLKDVCRLN